MEAARAIADPVRRRILVMLAGGPMTAGAIADAFAVSRPAVSRHLRVLREHGLVHDEAVGRERVYRLDVAPLAPVEAWIARLRASVALPGALDALATEVHRTRRDHARDRAGAGSPGASEPYQRAEPSEPSESAPPKEQSA